MKEVFYAKGVLMQIVIISILASTGFVPDQSRVKQQIPIPENINKIFQASCMRCHGNNGGRFPRSRLNFSRWTIYGPAKEAEKASSICSAVRKGVMPPKSVRISNPEIIPTKEQIELICGWAESAKSKSREK